MTETTAPIATRPINGAITVIAPASRIGHLDFGDTVTIEAGAFAGDTVQIGTGYTRDAEHGWGHYILAQSFTHPEHGDIVALFISTNHLAAAPKLAARLGANLRAAATEEARIDAEERRVQHNADRA